MFCGKKLQIPELFLWVFLSSCKCLSKSLHTFLTNFLKNGAGNLLTLTTYWNSDLINKIFLKAQFSTTNL